MGNLAFVPSSAAKPQPPDAPSRRVDQALIRELVEEHHRFVWRLLARLGVPEADLDDMTQQVFMVLTQREDLELKIGSEQSFLFGVTLKVAKTHRRTLARRREVGSEALPEPLDMTPSADALSDQRRARQILDQLLEEMPFEMRVVFVLFELDDMKAHEIATLLEVPPGTVASRLRRAREWFQRRVQQMQAREQFLEHKP